MHELFRFNPERYKKRRKYILRLTLLPILVCEVAATLIIVTNMRFFYQNGQLETAVYLSAGAAFLGTLIFFIVFAVTEKAISRHSRYTFFEIAEKSLIFSRYCGEVIAHGERTILRNLFVAHLSSLKSAGYNQKNGVIFLTASQDKGNKGESGKIRAYHDRDQRLKYELQNGVPAFESWWYNENCAEYITDLKIPRFFGGADISEQICGEIAKAKSNFDNAPKPKPYVHKESEYVKRRKVAEKLKKLL